jgi:DNA-binding response OmpR family regulator
MNKKIILVVEDQPEIRKLICMTLAFGPYEVHEADNGEVGMHMVNALRPHLVFMDVMMPGKLDGYQVCAQIKSMPDFDSVKVVMLTARGQRSDFDVGKQAGADSYLTKPFSPLELIKLAEKMIG